MNFFRNLFSTTPQKQDAQVKGLISLFFDLNKKNYTAIKLESEELTCDNILYMYGEKIKQQISRTGSSDLNDYDFILFDSLNPYTQIKLTPESKPLKYIFSLNQNLGFISKNPPKEKKINVMSMIQNESNIASAKKASNPSKNEIIFSCEIMRYNIKKQKFSKKKASLSDNEFIITSSVKKPMISISNIERINFTLTEASGDLKNIIKEDNIIEILLKSKHQVYIFRSKHKSDYDNWKANFEYVLRKRNDRLLDSSYNNIINDYQNCLSKSYVDVLNRCMSFNTILYIDDIRKMLFNAFPERLYTDIIDYTIEYKYNHYRYKYIESWCSFKMIISQLKADNESEEKKEKLSLVINQDKIDYYQQLGKDTNDLLSNVYKSSNSIETDLKDGIKNMLKFDLFDDLYENILKVITPVYKSYFSWKNDNNSNKKGKEEEPDNNSQRSEISFEYMLTHYFLKNYLFAPQIFLNLNAVPEKIKDPTPAPVSINNSTETRETK